MKVGNLSLSLFSGSVAADNISIADDPQFSKSAFVQAKSLKVGVEMMPFIMSKTLNVTELTLNEPEIALVKSENGEKWNFSSIGGSNAAAPKSTPQASSKAAPSAPSAPARAPPRTAQAAIQTCRSQSSMSTMGASPYLRLARQRSRGSTTR